MKERMKGAAARPCGSVRVPMVKVRPVRVSMPKGPMTVPVRMGRRCGLRVVVNVMAVIMRMCMQVLRYSVAVPVLMLARQKEAGGNQEQ